MAGSDGRVTLKSAAQIEKMARAGRLVAEVLDAVGDAIAPGVTTGDLDALAVVDDHPEPVAGPGEVLVRVRACAVNNTDINTRVGWYAQGEDDDGEIGRAHV